MPAHDPQSHSPSVTSVTGVKRFAASSLSVPIKVADVGFKHWTEVDVLRRGFDPGWSRAKTSVQGKPGVGRVAGRPPVHSSRPCAAANTWWKVKVQWGVSIFTRIMHCLSCSLSHTLDPARFISLLSFPQVIHVRTRGVAPLSTSDPVRFSSETQSIHKPLHFVGFALPHLAQCNACQRFFNELIL